MAKVRRRWSKPFAATMGHTLTHHLQAGHAPDGAHSVLNNVVLLAIAGKGWILAVLLSGHNGAVCDICNLLASEGHSDVSRRHLESA